MNPPQNHKKKLVARGFAVIVGAIVVVLAIAVLTLPPEATGLADDVEGQLDQSGVKNPVTAVLLNFRGYDTLLEVTVLLLALLGARALGSTVSHPDTQGSAAPNPVLMGFIRVIAPIMILVAGYLLWVGGHAPGGAFQAGAVLAALGVLLKLGDVNWTQHVSDPVERLLFILGVAVFLAIGVGTMVGERQLLEYSPPAAKWLILAIESAATVSIAAILLALFCGGTMLENNPSRQTRDERVGE